MTCRWMRTRGTTQDIRDGLNQKSECKQDEAVKDTGWDVAHVKQGKLQRSLRRPRKAKLYGPEIA